MNRYLEVINAIMNMLDWVDRQDGPRNVRGYTHGIEARWDDLQEAAELASEAVHNRVGMRQMGNAEHNLSRAINRYSAAMGTLPDGVGTEEGYESDY